MLKVKGAAPFSPMPGRPMKGFVLVPGSMVADEDSIAPWLQASLSFAAKLPAKKKKAAAAKKKK